MDIDVVILAAGFGTRMGDEYKDISKCLLTVNGKPILWNILLEINDIAKINNIKSITIVTNNKFYHSINSLCEDANTTLSLKNITIAVVNNGITSPTKRNGSIGDLALGISMGACHDNTPLLVIGADNYFTFHLKSIIDTINNRKIFDVTILTTTISAIEDACKYGVITVEDLSGFSRVTSFVEKPKKPLTKHVSTCIYLFKDKQYVMDYYYKHTQKRHELDKLGTLIENMIKDNKQVYSYHCSMGRWFDIGSNDTLKLCRLANACK